MSTRTGMGFRCGGALGRGAWARVACVGLRLYPWASSCLRWPAEREMGVYVGRPKFGVKLCSLGSESNVRHWKGRFWQPCRLALAWGFGAAEPWAVGLGHAWRAWASGCIAVPKKNYSSQTFIPMRSFSVGAGCLTVYGLLLCSAISAHLLFLHCCRSTVSI